MVWPVFVAGGCIMAIVEGFWDSGMVVIRIWA